MTDLPVGAYVASALMAANYPGDSGEDVDRFLAELDKRGYRVTRAASEDDLRDHEWCVPHDHVDHTGDVTGYIQPAAPAEGPCIFPGCVSRDAHSHGGFPGGHDNPDDPEGPPIPFTREAAPGVRDYNGALLQPAAPAEGLEAEAIRRWVRAWRSAGRSDEEIVTLLLTPEDDR